MPRLTLKVRGMHCAACELLIKEILEEAGAREVKASFKEGAVSLDLDEPRLTADKVKSLIQAEGYKVV